MPRCNDAKLLTGAAGWPVTSLPDQGRYIQILQRSDGAAVRQIMETAGWQAHTVQGAFAGPFRKMHYRRRPLDLLRSWYAKIEAWILEQAGVEFAPEQAGFRIVAGKTE